MTFKIEISQFMTKVNLKNGNETKSDFFLWTYLNLAPYLFYHNILLKYFNDFRNRNFSVL